MTYNKSMAVAKARAAYNAKYGSINKNMSLSSDDMKSLSTVARHLREAIYYELYGKFENKNLSFTSKKALAFAGSLKDAYVGVENPLFIVLKIAVCMQNLSQDENYDFTDYWTDSLATGLWNLLKELNVAHDYQTVYTINALLSGFEIKPDIDALDNFHKRLVTRIRPMQRDVNNYLTQPGNIQLAYRMGLIITDGYNDQHYDYREYRTKRLIPYSRLRFDLALIYQNEIGLSPLILYHKPIENQLSVNDQTAKWFYDIYFLNHDIEFTGKNITDEDIREEFHFNNGMLKSLSMESVARLGLNVPNAVQAFALDNRNPNKYNIYTLQFNQKLLGNQEIIQIGSFNPNDISDQYHMPVGVFNKKITINGVLAAHSQTFAMADNNYHEFFIGFYRSINAPKSNVPWAQWIGLFDLTNGTNEYNAQSRMPYLCGFDAYRLEATTDLDHDLLITQTISENHDMQFIKYRLSDILDALHKKYNDNKDKENATIADFGVNIKQFKILDSFSIPGNNNIIDSIQGFAYDSKYNEYDSKSSSIIITSQFAPNVIRLNMDQSLPLPHYNKLRAIYVIPWQEIDPSRWTEITLTNFKNTSIKELINRQVDDSQQPIVYGTELESNILFSNNSMYQLIVYHWSDHDLVKQDNLNALVHIFWDSWFN